MRLNRLGCCVGIVAFAFISCNGRSLDLVNQQNNNAAANATNSNSPINQNQGDTKSEGTLYFLDLEKPHLEQPVATGDREVEGSKFVQVEVTEVINPQKHPVGFEVRYQPNGQEQIFLGTFSLYPSDNPGRFIVATQGKVKGEGKIILSLVTSDKVAAGDTLRVGVKRIKLLKG